ncbi:Uncharacterised protein [Vibrio cholerae]|nr:Uncharacterised protein [Vibrio cholerae]
MIHYTRFPMGSCPAHHSARCATGIYHRDRRHSPAQAER